MIRISRGWGWDLNNSVRYTASELRGSKFQLPRQTNLDMFYQLLFGKCYNCLE